MTLQAGERAYVKASGVFNTILRIHTHTHKNTPRTVIIFCQDFIPYGNIPESKGTIAVNICCFFPYQPRLLSTFTIVCQALGHKLGNSHEQKRAAPCSGAARSRKGSAGLWAPRGRCGPPGRAAAVALAPGHSWPLQDCFQGQSVLAHCED